MDFSRFCLNWSHLTASHIWTHMWIVYSENILTRCFLSACVHLSTCTKMSVCLMSWEIQMNPVMLPFQHSLDFIKTCAMCLLSLTPSHSTVLYTYSYTLISLVSNYLRQKLLKSTAVIEVSASSFVSHHSCCLKLRLNF